MSGEFTSVWENQNSPQYELNAKNLSFISPHLMHIGKRLFLPVSGNRQKLTLKKDTVVKMVMSGIHKLYRVNSDIDFFPAAHLDSGSALAAGKDYHIYLVTNADNTANLVVSNNATYPAGANAANSRRIGGFHTLCADVGSAQDATHPLYNANARDILPQSIWDLLHRPRTCEPQGMVFDPQTKIWVDIYLQSGTGVNTASVFGGSITHTSTFDDHQEDFNAVGKRMLTDAEFSSIALGTLGGVNIKNSTNPVITGGHLNTNDKRIISNIGCEDCCGVFWQWIGHASAQAYNIVSHNADGTVKNSIALNWETNPNTDRDGRDGGKQYLPSNAVLAGGSWANSSSCGFRCRYADHSRSVRHGYHSSRGSADAQTVI